MDDAAKTRHAGPDPLRDGFDTFWCSLRTMHADAYRRGKTVEVRRGRFSRAKKGDLLFLYESTPAAKLFAVCGISDIRHASPEEARRGWKAGMMIDDDEYARYTSGAREVTVVLVKPRMLHPDDALTLDDLRQAGIKRPPLGGLAAFPRDIAGQILQRICVRNLTS